MFSGIPDVSTWMFDDHCKLNISKTEFRLPVFSHIKILCVFRYLVVSDPL